LPQKGHFLSKNSRFFLIFRKATLNNEVNAGVLFAQ
jgi:hypothetical protein